ncbi:hypothetical protein DFO70_13121 [Cytobacillus firmus]|uniref:Uncharacterized protein n=2 Tax=Cytobacillus TaxID=2675230 RepID=A0A366JGT7_CYTFI|nr:MULTISPECIES: hypothetical protein [Cytobacillus]RBP86188.1 hypothetical protein DFO70_13121 [Cytobacillus firmus]TDX36399.1 hypothetical protein DFO72_12016 [Cytobacillus oceanisediminis]
MMKKIIACMSIIALMSFGGTALAASPTEHRTTSKEDCMIVSADDCAAISRGNCLKMMKKKAKGMSMKDCMKMMKHMQK